MLSLIYRNRKLVYYLLIFMSSHYWSCAVSAPPAGSKLYKPEASLSREIAYSLTTPLKLQIPVGWFTSEDNNCKCIDLWLIRDDFSATINLITLNAPLYPDSVDNELNRILAISKEKRSEKLSNEFIQTKEDEFFTLNERKFASYEFQGDEGLPIRVVVFRYGDKYFELSAMPASKVGSQSVNPQELFTVQQSVLISIK